MTRPFRFALIALLLAHAPLALAAEPPKLDPANTAWMLTSSVLVLFMTLPGLALFYGGLVRAKNVLSVLMQCFSIACVVTIAWVVVGYSIAFGDGGPLNAWYGGFAKSFLPASTSRRSAPARRSRKRCSLCSSSPSRSLRRRWLSAPTPSA
jgi:Amt family ammonium transporter